MAGEGEANVGRMWPRMKLEGISLFIMYINAVFCAVCFASGLSCVIYREYFGPPIKIFKADGPGLGTPLAKGLDLLNDLLPHIIMIGALVAFCFTVPGIIGLRQRKSMLIRLYFLYGVISIQLYMGMAGVLFLFFAVYAQNGKMVYYVIESCGLSLAIYALQLHVIKKTIKKIDSASADGCGIKEEDKIAADDTTDAADLLWNFSYKYLIETFETLKLETFTLLIGYSNVVFSTVFLISAVSGIGYGYMMFDTCSLIQCTRQEQILHLLLRDYGPYFLATGALASLFFNVLVIIGGHLNKPVLMRIYLGFGVVSLVVGTGVLALAITIVALFNEIQNMLVLMEIFCLFGVYAVELSVIQKTIKKVEPKKSPSATELEESEENLDDSPLLNLNKWSNPALELLAQFFSYVNMILCGLFCIASTSSMIYSVSEFITLCDCHCDIMGYDFHDNFDYSDCSHIKRYIERLSNYVGPGILIASAIVVFCFTVILIKGIEEKKKRLLRVYYSFGGILFMLALALVSIILMIAAALGRISFMLLALQIIRLLVCYIGVQLYVVRLVYIKGFEYQFPAEESPVELENEKNLLPSAPYMPKCLNY